MTSLSRFTLFVSNGSLISLCVDIRHETELHGEREIQSHIQSLVLIDEYRDSNK
jgi:hypothetical protein